MIVFWLACAVMIVVAVAFVLPPLLQSEGATNEAEVEEANIAVYRDQLRELEADFGHGIISKEQHAQDRDEIERRLLEDVSVTSNARTAQNAPNNNSLVIWGTSLVVVGVGSLLLPLLESQFRLLTRFHEMLGNAQPAAGIFIAVLGCVFLLRGIRTNRGMAYAMAIGVPVLAIAFYLPLANQNARAKTQAAEEAPPASAAPFANQSGAMTPQAIEANIAKLAKKMEENPNDVNGWKMLARSYSEMQRYKDAAEAYEHATALESTNADLWADYAYAVMMVNGKELQGKPLELVNKALAIDPLNQKALILAGNAAFASKNYDQAIAYWEKVLKSLPPNSTEVSQPMTERIAEAKRLAKEAPAK
jgi:cytochrome c-type biogenesis protein CcmI